MEKIEENVVTKGAKPAEPMQKMAGGEVEDLGGPTPENYKPDDDSAKLKTPGATLKQVKDVVNKGAKPAEGGSGMKEEEEVEGEVVAENEVATDEVVAEEESSEEEVVAPKPPNRTFDNDLFIALHMIFVRISPLAPTKAPATISTLLLITKPAEEAARPE